MTALPLQQRARRAAWPAARIATLRSAPLLALTALAALGGCALGPTRCESDADCGAELCTRSGECASVVVFVRARWTVNGQPPSEASCAAHPWLSVTFEDRDFDEELTYEPFRCTLGQVTFDRMPARYETVELVARDGDGAIAASHRSAIEPPGIEIDWDLAARVAPTN